jgi:hypothetical protein
MSVIRHQTPSKNIDAKAVQLFGHKIEVGSSITIGLENRNGSYTPLRDVMRIARSYHPGNSRHAQNLFEPNAFSQEKISIVSPEFSPARNKIQIDCNIHQLSQLVNVKFPAHRLLFSVI